MTTLLTGINGFLGSSIAADLVADGVDVVGLDVTGGDTETPWPVETLDVRDRDALRTLIGDLGVEVGTTPRFLRTGRVHVHGLCR